MLLLFTAEVDRLSNQCCEWKNTLDRVQQVRATELTEIKALVDKKVDTTSVDTCLSCFLGG